MKMSTYNYVAAKPDGTKVKDKIEASDEQSAAKLLEKEGLIPVEIKNEAYSFLGAASKHIGHIKSRDRVLFARQLATLINAGLPVLQSLRSVIEQTNNKSLKNMIAEIANSIEGGSSLSAAMSKYPKVFNEVFISLVASGEASGTLDTTLDRAAVQQEKDADIVSKIRGAMIYPVIVLIVMLAVVVFMLVKVLPQVQVLYATFPGSQLPIETRVLLDVSHFIIKQWWLALIVLVVVVVFGFKYFKTKNGTKVIDTLKLRMPPFNILFRKIYMARFCRIGSTLVAAGVPLLQILNILGNAVSNVLVKESIVKAAEKVKGGKALSECLKGDPNFLPLVPNMLHIGEESGAMEKMLAKAAEYYEKEVDEEIKNISSLIEPVMMIILGLMALLIVAAVLLPIYALAGSGNIQF